MSEVNGWILDEYIPPSASLKQGDLIKFTDETDPLRKVGIVVTADCDLSNKKHAKLVTLIPVVTVKDIMENYLLLEDCDRKKEQIENYAFRELRIEKQPDIEINQALLRSSIENTSGSDISESILTAVKIVTDQVTSISISEYTNLMHTLGISKKKADALSDQIRTRGDLLILPSPQDLGVTNNIAWVRQIWQVPLTSIALRTSETSSRKGEKIARLESPFRYRLTQLMAQVFSDIGLPDVKDSVQKEISGAYGNV
ncbi:hypothetical protein JJJ22_10995 [Aeromonas caviae]|uniref:hypothetical protein n=1 Tax=Aeromonas caviae TaxID=648 RepID=UPI0019086872|nr:hypothetical protein [Aeromonas caviae]MDX7820536.1 hypothetical protein [Aeromonas caviae]QQM77092.1 hypothetical protein JH254_07475 [Aeromonas caviae]QQV17785.1 hypothetical protein JJJ22_10995 [Aeromonas caviae]